jgi:serine/threonine-protein kinase
VAAGAVFFLLDDPADRVTRGTGAESRARPDNPGLRTVSLSQNGAKDYDPESTGGDGREHPNAAKAVLDDDPGSSWDTETYRSSLADAGKQGVGIYVDAKPSAAARQIRIDTTTPGWDGAVYGARSGPPADIKGWTKLAAVRDAARRERVTLPGERYRYYLVWITKLPEGGKVDIPEINLFQRRSS